MKCWSYCSMVYKAQNSYPVSRKHVNLYRHVRNTSLSDLVRFKLIECCWNSDSASRPSFLELVTHLQEVIAQFKNKM